MAAFFVGFSTWIILALGHVSSRSVDRFEFARRHRANSSSPTARVFWDAAKVLQAPRPKLMRVKGHRGCSRHNHPPKGDDDRSGRRVETG